MSDKKSSGSSTGGGNNLSAARAAEAQSAAQSTDAARHQVLGAKLTYSNRMNAHNAADGGKTWTKGR